jgi:hypothetical protein
MGTGGAIARRVVDAGTTGEHVINITVSRCKTNEVTHLVYLFYPRVNLHLCDLASVGPLKTFPNTI